MVPDCRPPARNDGNTSNVGHHGFADLLAGSKQDVNNLRGLNEARRARPCPSLLFCTNLNLSENSRAGPMIDHAVLDPPFGHADRIVGIIGIA